MSSTTMHNDVYRSATFPIDARKKEVEPRWTQNASTKTIPPKRRGKQQHRSFASDAMRSASTEEKEEKDGTDASKTIITDSQEEKVPKTNDGVHTKREKKDAVAQTYMLAHPVYDFGYIESIRPRHRQPQGARDYVSMFAVWSARKGFDAVTNYSHEKSMTKDEWLFRFIFLETVAGIPGMVAGMLRHMHSLRLLRHDNGWIHTLLEEAENERMHLMTFLNMKQPSILFRAGVLAAQGVFFNAFFFSYLFSPRTCHRFVGYLEEEAVRTYTHALSDIDTGGTDARQWAKERAPKLAIEYWKMDEDATVRDVLLAVRADEASHAHVNHTFSSMGTTQKNPFVKGESHLPENFVEPPPGFVPSEENRVARDADSF